MRAEAYFRPNSDIDFNHLTKFIITICAGSQSPCVIFSANDLLRRFLNNKKVKIKKQYTIASACVLISSKYNEDYPISISDILIHVNVNASKIIRYEKKILKKLQWSFNVTEMDYIIDVYNLIQPIINDLISSCKRLLLTTIRERYLPCEIVYVCIVLLSIRKNKKAMDALIELIKIKPSLYRINQHDYRLIDLLI